MIPSVFISVNVIDTCAVWNLISSETLFFRSLSCRHSYVVTETVLYECLQKTRGRDPKSAHVRLRDVLQVHLRQNRFAKYKISIEDLQVVAGLSSRLGRGELSCAAAAKKLNQAVMTDNKKDFDALSVLVDGRLQTTPRLLGWLVWRNFLGDAEVIKAIDEHRQFEGHMSKHYQTAYREACEKRLAQPPGTE